MGSILGVGVSVIRLDYSDKENPKPVCCVRMDLRQLGHIVAGGGCNGWDEE